LIIGGFERRAIDVGRIHDRVRGCDGSGSHGFQVLAVERYRRFRCANQFTLSL